MEVKSTSPTRRRIIAKVFGFLAVALIFLAGYILGSSPFRPTNKVDLSQFWQVYQLISGRSVHPIDNKKASEGAVSGLVQSLGDPFSAYLPPTENKNLADELKGQFEGIGAELTQKDQLITVVAPLAGSPAETAGLKTNDIILKVDDLSTENLSLNEVVDKIRGPKDSQVKLTIARQGQDQPIELKITRANIQVKSVNHKMIGAVGYLGINQFGDDTISLAQTAIRDLVTKKPKAVIIDLRNNPGGYLNAVAPIAGQFLPPSVVVKEKYRDGKTDEVRSTDVPIMPDTPIYVLVNGGSASAAEILAGALQDYGRAKLIGQKTFGKGSVQDLIPLKDGAALRLTIAEWLTPKDRAINKVGIEPDVKVDGEKTADKDPILDKALELANAR